MAVKTERERERVPIWRAVRSRGAQFEQVLCYGLWLDLDSVFAVFQKVSYFQTSYTVFLFVLDGATNSAKLLSKIAKSPKFCG